ncbi:MAG: hypothetical protein EZS26_003142 [Candidatus Ordinivivax streblomastigis]|uniref:GYF domain-containing protein n=1 Tax=Candidatus Ordinivivax streblomastigis TaxID=2540710 RepID=A0A5M8NWI3_9BACT|nr:MAG: hypothetical protein EZS26_003142 [Candidatus Ordinivivax streblomastigis]
MYVIYRNNQQFGPYSIDVLSNYVEDDKILRCDKASDMSNLQELKTYNTLGWSIAGLLLTVTGVILLMSYLKQGVNYQSKLSK